jgi:hypothetical protein
MIFQSASSSKPRHRFRSRNRWAGLSAALIPVPAAGLCVVVLAGSVAAPVVHSASSEGVQRSRRHIAAASFAVVPTIVTAPSPRRGQHGHAVRPGRNQLGTRPVPARPRQGSLPARGRTAQSLGYKRDRPGPVYRIRHIVSGGQATIDACRATAWQGRAPGRARLVWLAGHDYCGYAWWGRIPNGALVKLVGAWGVWTYRVYGHGAVHRHSGSSAGLIHRDLTLQTCRGSWTAFTYARRVK